MSINNLNNMNDLYNLSLILIFGSAVLVFLLLFFVTAPYGKFNRQGWGPAIKAKWAWMIMEFPSPALMVLFFIISPDKGPVVSFFLVMWLMHYLHRTFMYPFVQSGGNKNYPLVVAAMAFVFNIFNGTANGYGIFNQSGYQLSWFYSWQFVSGLIVFLGGFLINKISDEKLRILRNGNPGEYRVPRGWLFRYISSPHYFGEIVEWGGWALMTWSLSGLAFFVFTFANLFPRAISSHRWYKATFPDYPPERKAVIPFII
jgi:protein-S-isoprenylcysteine O-methyltransferase Ste14